MNIQPHQETHTFQVYLTDSDFDFITVYHLTYKLSLYFVKLKYPNCVIQYLGE